MSSKKQDEIWQKMKLKDVERGMLVNKMQYYNDQAYVIKKAIQKLDKDLQRLSDKHMNLYP